MVVWGRNSGSGSVGSGSSGLNSNRAAVPGCVTWGECLTLSERIFSHLQIGESNSSLTELFWRLRKNASLVPLAHRKFSISN